MKFEKLKHSFQFFQISTAQFRVRRSSDWIILHLLWNVKTLSEKLKNVEIIFIKYFSYIQKNYKYFLIFLQITAAQPLDQIPGCLKISYATGTSDPLFSKGKQRLSENFYKRRLCFLSVGPATGLFIYTVGIRKPDISGFQMVDLGPVFEWRSDFEWAAIFY